MDIEKLHEYALSKPGAQSSFPFDPETLVLKVGGKIFCIIPLDKYPLVFSVKTDPEWSATLRESYPQINCAWHLNKKHWNSVVCDGLKPELIYSLIDHSYDIVYQSLTKKIKEEIQAQK